MRPLARLASLLLACAAFLVLPGAARADALDAALAAGELTGAKYSLERARALFRLADVRARHGAVERPDGHDATLYLRDLRAALPRLAGGDRAEAQALLARPTADDEPDDPFGTADDDDPPRVDCGPHVCVHWTESGPDAAPPADADGNGIPDGADAARRVFHEVWAAEVGRLGYRPPLDDSDSGTNGGDGRFDVYLVDIGDDGYFGYCTTDNPAADDFSRVSAFCVVENDFAERAFAAMTPLEALRVTAAHEFFHAIQFGYDWLEDTWLIEGTAAWIEDEVFDAIDDNRRFLGVASPLVRPDVPLDHGRRGHEYGAWIYWRFLAERFGRSVVRDVWERAEPVGAHDRYSLAAVDAALRDRGATFTSVFTLFGAANRLPERYYDEGRAYWPAPARRRHVLAPGTASAHGSASLPHLTTQTVSFHRGAGTRSTSRLLLTVEANGATGARALVVPAKGRPQVVALASGRSASVRFGRGVRRVDLVLANAGTGYACWRGTALSCRGVALDDGHVVTYRAALG